MSHGLIVEIRSTAPRRAIGVNVRGGYLAPGFIDVHVWGDPRTVSRAAARHGTTAFLATVGPAPQRRLLEQVAGLLEAQALEGAQCLGVHLEGPFLNPARAGALPRRWMRPPTVAEVEALVRAGGTRLRLVTIAPELRGALAAIRRLRAAGVAVSLGHSEADPQTALRAVEAGARAVTHVFNGMPPFHHRRPSLLDVALTDPRLTAMVIADGVHVSQPALRLLWRAKGSERVALVTDSIRHQPGTAMRRGGAYSTPRGVLAGSRLTMIRAVQQMVAAGGVSLIEAIRMATAVPATLLGLHRTHGTLAVGKRADLVAFDRHLRVLLTAVGGRLVYQR
mgnify:CR=1 FL=1